MRYPIAILLGILVVLPAALVAEEDPATLYETARKAEEKRDFTAAVAAYDKILEIDEEYQDAFERWDVCIKLAEWQEALEGAPGAMDLVRLGELYVELLDAQGDDEAARGELLEAERACYEDAIQMDPDCREAHGHLALSHYAGRGSMVTVIDETYRFLQASPYKERLGDAIAGFRVYGEARRAMKPADSKAIRAARKAKDWKKAAAVCEKAAAAKDLPDVHYTFLWSWVGRYRLMLRDAEGARKAFEESLAHVPYDASTIQARLGLAALDTKAGDLKAALAHLEAAVEQGANASVQIANQKSKAYKPLFEADDAAVRDAVAKLADAKLADQPIRDRIAEAVAKAKSEKKKVLLHWYGPYCPYVMAMEERLAHPKVRDLIAKHYVHVKMDQGSGAKGITLDKEYGNVMREHGVPCFFVLDDEGEVETVQPDLELMGTPHRDFDAEKIAEFLARAAGG